MAKYRKILVAMDGSDSGKNALKQAFRLADMEDSWMVGVSVAPAYEGDLSLVGVQDIEAALTGPYERVLSEAREMAKVEGRYLKTSCEQGEPYERIIDLAEAENCDLVIMGRKGIGKLEKVLMGKCYRPGSRA